MFEKIPNPITNPFRRLKNTIVMPGVSAISVQAKERLKIHASTNIKKVIDGNNPEYIIV